MTHNWYAVITAKVLLSKNITDKQKLLIALISNLSTEKGYCFASNKYLGDCLNCSEVTIRQNIASLEQLGCLGRVIKLNEKNEIEYRSLKIIEDFQTPPIKFNQTPDENQSLPPDENQSHNNKLFNNTIDFSKFWDLYGLKVGKAEAEKAWKKIKYSDQEKCLEALPNWLKCLKKETWRKKPHPSTFINNRRWEDEISESCKESNLFEHQTENTNWVAP